MEFLHVRARSIINEIKGGAGYLPFRFTINAYRGCSHACSYCQSGDTPVLMADGTTRLLVDLRVGDRVYGTVRRGNHRRYEPTTVRDHWSTWKPAYRVTLADGTTLVASGDHRFLTGRGWKYVTRRRCGCGPHLTTDDSLIGTGQFGQPPKHDIDGLALKSDADLRVVSVEPLGIEIPMYDIATGTGDFIANGVVSHNCFARPTHAYLDMDIGEDFERRIVVKVNAVERLRVELDPRRWAGDHIAMGTNTDPYQRCEGKYRLTRGLVEVLGEAGNPFSILTKSTLILRDLDLLVAAAERTSVRVNLSIGTLDEEVWRTTEPGTPHPRQRVEAVRKLNAAGISTGVLVAPILPGISDGRGQIDEVVGACIDAGAVSVSSVLLHLRPGVKEHYLDSLRATRPDLVERYAQLYGTRSYAPKDERRRVSALVQRALRRHGGVRPVTFKDQVPTEMPVTAPRRRPTETDGQLSFL